jgi:hypothetical protein
MSRDAPVPEPQYNRRRGRDRVSRKRLQIDWVAVLINTTLLIAAMMFVAVAGMMIWAVY